MSLHQTETSPGSAGSAGSATLAPGATPGGAPDAPAEKPKRPRLARGYSIRPAMTVLVLAVVIVGVFVTIGIVSTHRSATVRTTAPISRVPGSDLQARAAAGSLSVIRTGGDPPANIVNGVLLPAGSVRISHQDNAGSQYDQQVTFRSAASQAALLDFFASAMHRSGWRIFDRGPAAHAPGTTEILGKLAGSDGYYWEMGVVVAPTTFGPGAPATGTTTFTIRLYQVGDTQ